MTQIELSRERSHLRDRGTARIALVRFRYLSELLSRALELTVEANSPVRRESRARAAREHIPRVPLWSPSSSSFSVWLRPSFGAATFRRYLTLPLPGAEHLVRAGRRVSRWHAPPKSRAATPDPFLPLPTFPFRISRVHEREGKKRERVEAASRLAKNRNEARPEGKSNTPSATTAARVIVVVVVFVVVEGCRRSCSCARFLAWS